MKIVNCLFLVFLFCSCSTLKRSITSGVFVGSVVGGIGGHTFSPDKESQGKNAYLFGVVGALAGAGLAYMLDDNKPISTGPMILPVDEVKKNSLPLFDFSPELKEISPEVNFKPLSKYEVPIEKLPKELEGKVKKQFVIEYEAPEQVINIGTRTISVGPFNAWEHVYE